MELSERIKLRLVVLNAMIGRVSAELAVLCANIGLDRIFIRAYFFSDISERDSEYIDDIATAIIASLPDRKVDFSCSLLSSFDVAQVENVLFLRAEAESLISGKRND